jgi:hypothetical protein
MAKSDEFRCPVTCHLKGIVGDGPLNRCEGDLGHKGHHHFQVEAVLHRPRAECRHCDAVKEEKRIEQKVQVSFWIA